MTELLQVQVRASGTDKYSVNVRYSGTGASPGLQFGATNSDAARIARKHLSSPRADATHACACVPWTLPLLFSPPSSSSSLSAGRRAGAGRKSIVARRWSERAEIARWAGLNGGSARVLNTSYLADRWVLRLPLAQLVACWLVGSDLHWWTLGSCGTGGAWASISRYATPAAVRKPRLFPLAFVTLRAVHHHRSGRSCPVDSEQRSSHGRDRSLLLSQLCYRFSSI